MDTHDRDLVQSWLDHSRDLRYGFEAKCLPTQIKQARLYCSRVDETLQIIQAAVEKGTDVRAMDVKSFDEVDGFIVVG